MTHYYVYIRRHYIVKPSRAISCDDIGLVPVTSETVSVLASGVDVMHAGFPRYIYTLNRLSAAPARIAWVTTGIVKQSDVKTKPSLTRLMARQDLIALVI
jgi:hypothetical protein